MSASYGGTDETCPVSTGGEDVERERTVPELHSRPRPAPRAQTSAPTAPPPPQRARPEAGAARLGIRKPASEPRPQLRERVARDPGARGAERVREARLPRLRERAGAVCRCAKSGRRRAVSRRRRVPRGAVGGRRQRRRAVGRGPVRSTRRRVNPSPVSCRCPISGRPVARRPCRERGPAGAAARTPSAAAGRSERGRANSSSSSSPSIESILSPVQSGHVSSIPPY